MDLPIELLSKIFGFSDEQSLIILLRASWLFQILTEPVLYRNVTLYLYDDLDQLPGIERFKQRTIVEHPRLAVFVVSCTVTVTATLVLPILPEVPTMLAKLINLRRLWIGDIFPDADLHMCFSSTTRLTHLYCDRIVDITAFTRFLESQPLLEQLEFKYFGSDQFILPSSALPRLRTFGGCVQCPMSILPGRDIHHLRWHFFLDYISHGHLDSSVPSLSIHTLQLTIGLRQSDIVTTLMRLFPNLKYLQFDIGGEMDALENFKDLLYPLAISQVEYIYIRYLGECLPQYQDEIASVNLLATYLKDFRSLHILDFEFDEKLYSPVAYRHLAGRPVPAQLTLPASDCRSWELWWESRKLEGALHPRSDSSVRSADF